jgi:hypothetical protein
MCKKYFADVEWVKPGRSTVSSGNRLLSLDEYDGSHDVVPPYLAFSSGGENRFGVDRYLFENQEQAEAFRKDVHIRYAQEPLYCVIDDDGELVLDLHGEKQVAWEPFITLAPARLEEVQALLAHQ